MDGPALGRGRLVAVTEDDVLLPYVSGLHASWLAEGAEPAWREVPGTLVFADVSGFTPLAERLAKRGKVGAEQLTDTLNVVFRQLLDVASGLGGDCLKFGGDALLLLFEGEGHERRGAAAAHGMLAALRSLRRSGLGEGLSKLGMSLGVHSGLVHVFLAGTTHRELLVAGPTVSGALALESAAEAGEILLSDATAAALDASDWADGDGIGIRLRRAPAVPLALADGLASSHAGAAEGVPRLLRAHLDGSQREGEHRLASIGFLKFGHTDRLLSSDGPAAVAVALDELVEVVQDACAHHEVTFLGTDVDRDGGKVLLATGTPSASPDDEDRLLIALRQAIDGITHLPVRAGVNRGRIFAVDLGSPARRTFTVMGDAVNLAARVMGHGEWGQLLATQDVLDRRRTEFDLVALAPFGVKGKSEPVAAQVVGAPRGRRDEGAEIALPLVGREREAGIIRQALAAAHHGEGHVIELVGEPGIGKSKLLAAMTSTQHGLARFTFEAGRYSLLTPYFALRRGLRHSMGLSADAPDTDVEASLRAIVAAAAPQLESLIPLLGIPLGLQLPDTPETARLDPANRQSRLQAAVVELMVQLLAEPTLITIEDAHWLDSASAELLLALLHGVERRSWAVLLTRRPVAGGLELPDSVPVTPMRLEALDRAALVQLAVASARGRSLAPGVIDELVDRSGGNPLFLQELVRAAMRGSVSELPDSIEAVIASSIDTLDPEDRALLRHAAVLGNQFPVNVLAPMLGEPHPIVAEGIDRLAHFLVPLGDGVIRFRHILLRDVAYEGLAFRARRALHQRAGEILEQSASQPEALAELLAIHFHQAGRFDASWRYSRVAGERAQRNGAPVEAAGFYERALDSAKRLRDVALGEQAEVAEHLGDVLEMSGRYEPARHAYSQARRLARNDPLRRGRLCRKLGLVRDREGHYGQAQRWYSRGLRELDAVDGRGLGALRAQLLTQSASSKLRQGRHGQALPLLESAIAAAEPTGDAAARAFAYTVLDQVLVDQGRFSEARYSALAVPLYDELRDDRGLATAYNQLGNIAYWRGEWDEAVKDYESALDADRRGGGLVTTAIYLNNIGEIRSDQGRFDEAEALLFDAYEIWNGGGWRHGAGWALSNLGRAASRAGRFEEAQVRLAGACRIFTEIGADSLLLETEARNLERLVLQGEHAEALEVWAELSPRADKVGVVSVINLVQRLEAYARCQAGDLERGWALLEANVATCQERGAEYEAALGREGLLRVAPLLGRPVDPEVAEAARTAFERLGVIRTPTIPLPPRT